MWKTWDLWLTSAKNVQCRCRASVYTLDRHTSPMANDVVIVLKPRASTRVSPISSLRNPVFLWSAFTPCRSWLSF